MTEPHWPGLVKMQEEAAELGVALAKLSAYPVGPHPDGCGICLERVRDEMADVIAAIQWFCERNGVTVDWSRVDRKVALFFEWDRAEGMAGRAVKGDGVVLMTGVRACPGCGASPVSTIEGACAQCGDGHK